MKTSFDWILTKLHININVTKKILAGTILCTAMISLCACTKKHEAYVSTSTEIRDNTPVCLVPEASGVDVYKDDNVSIDYSNVADGYVMITYLGKSSDVKIQITGPDYMTYTYDLNDNHTETFPISAGDGEYKIGVYELIEGTSYSTVCSITQDFLVTNTLGAFLYPNQYVKFDKDKKVIAKGSEVVAPAHDDLEAINYVYNYIVNTIDYDTEKAETVQGGYIPDVDEILEIKKGICLDYASVMTSMLRSQRIPTRMEVGYAGKAYHAWISTYAENIGWINGIIEFDGNNWSIMDPTVAANQGEEALVSFIGDGGSYMTKYIY